MNILASHALILGKTLGLGVLGFTVRSRLEVRKRWHIGLRTMNLRARHAWKYAQKNMVLYKAVAVSRRDMIPPI